MVDRQKYSAIAHREHRHFHPIPEEKLALLETRLDLPRGATVVDYGCGRAEWLLRLALRFPIRAVGVDHSARFIEWGRARVAEAGLEERVELICGDAREHARAAQPADLVLCIGAGQIFGRPSDNLTALLDLVRPGGSALYGEGYWKQEPAAEYLEALGDTRKSLPEDGALSRMAAERGWEPLARVTASLQDWDRYESAYRDGIDSYVLDNPDDADSSTMADRARSWYELYLRHGRDTLGFAIYLLGKPA